MAAKLVIPRGPLAPWGVMIVGGLVGLALATRLFTHFWLIGIFGVLILALVCCFSGIEFDSEKKQFREYYRMLFFKLGKWQSYQEYAYISVQAVILKRNTDLPDKAAPAASNPKYSTKIMLLNEQHHRKLLVTYSKNAERTNQMIRELQSHLHLPFVKYNPPVSEATLRRKRSRGR